MEYIKQETVILFSTIVLCGIICAFVIHKILEVPKVVPKPKPFVCEVKSKNKFMLDVYMVFKDCKIIIQE